MIIRSKPIVLIVDDIPDNIHVLSEALRDNYTVKAALNGKMAITVATTQDPPPDLILLDVMMPEMDGYEVCRYLKSDLRTKNIPVIFVTAKSEETDEQRGFEAGAVDYIAKPISPPIVLKRIQTQLALYDRQRYLEEIVNERTEELKNTRLEIIQRLGRAAEFKDDETGLHVIRMSRYSEQIALSYGLDREEAALILNTSPMHDIGKIGIPDNIISKPGKLNDEEWEEIRKHPAIGAHIIGEHSSTILKYAHIASLSHHEKWDGTGYPEGLSGEDIPLIGRILALADVLDALTSKRPYKDPWPLDRAVGVIMEEKGKHFDPKVVDAFEKCLPEIKEIYDQLAD